MANRLISKEIIKDIAEGMANAGLMEKYGLSHNQLRGVFRGLVNARKKRIAAITQDISSGMSRSELSNKYGLSPDALTSVLYRLLEENLIRQTEIDNLTGVSADETKRLEARSQIRIRPVPVVALCEVGKPRRQYVLRDITERGLGVEGIKATPSEIIHFMVLGDEMGGVWPFELEAECRWAGPIGEGGEMCAGFQVSKISKEDLGRLRDLLQNYTFGFGVQPFYQV